MVQSRGNLQQVEATLNEFRSSLRSELGCTSPRPSSATHRRAAAQGLDDVKRTVLASLKLAQSYSANPTGT